MLFVFKVQNLHFEIALKAQKWLFVPMDIGEVAVLIVADNQGVSGDSRHLVELEPYCLFLEPPLFIHDEKVFSPRLMISITSQPIVS